jgi:YggT family protein
MPPLLQRRPVPDSCQETESLQGEVDMFVMGNFLQAVAAVLDALLNLYWWLIIGSVVVSWIGADPYNPIIRFLRGATEPVFYQIRTRLPMVFGGMDFTPIVVLLAIQFLRIFLVQSLYQAADGLGGQDRLGFLL